MIISSEIDMKQLGISIGRQLRGGECIELIGDVGAGKTTLTKGIGEGLEVDDDVQSPSFTISRTYPARNGLFLSHYDFYRLPEPGVMSYELKESLGDMKTVTVVEWGETVQDILPSERIRLYLFHLPADEGRRVVAKIPEALAYMKVNV